MENKNNTSEYPVFPVENYLGMSKRFYVACIAMQGLLHNVNSYSIIRNGKTLYASLIEDAYKFADELLRQEYGE